MKTMKLKRQSTNLFRTSMAILAITGVLVTLSSPVRAAVAVTNYVNPGASYMYASASSQSGIGYYFTVGASDVQVTSLAIWYPTPGDYGGTMVTANSGTDSLYIGQDIGGSSALVLAKTTVNVDANVTVPDAQGFQYASLSSPVILTAGQSYFIFADVGTNYYGNVASGAFITMSSDFTTTGYGASFDASFTGNVGPSVGDTISASGPQYIPGTAFGPLNFEYTTVPEPGTVSAVLLGACGLMGLRLVRRKKVS